MKHTRRLLVAVIGVIVFLGPASISYALWSASATGAVTIKTASAPTLSAPGNYRCTTAPNKNQRNVAWNPVTGATEYRLYVLKSGTWTLFKTVPGPTVTALLKDNEIQGVPSPQQTLVRAATSSDGSGDSNIVTLKMGDTTTCP